MDGAALLASYRQRGDDAIDAEFVDDATAYRFASEAEREACVRAKLIYDDTSTFTTLAVADATANYTLDERIQHIDRVTYTATSGGPGCDLVIRGIDWIRERDSGLTMTGRPMACVRIGRTLKLWPTPTSASWPTPTSASVGTLQLGVYRLPLCDIARRYDEPEIPVEHHEALVDWMLVLTYRTKDSQLEDPARADKHERLFTDHFGERLDAETLRRHREKRRITTRYGGL